MGPSARLSQSGMVKRLCRRNGLVHDEVIEMRPLPAASGGHSSFVRNTGVNQLANR